VRPDGGELRRLLHAQRGHGGVERGCALDAVGGEARGNVRQDNLRHELVVGGQQRRGVLGADQRAQQPLLGLRR